MAPRHNAYRAFSLTLIFHSSYLFLRARAYLPFDGQYSSFPFSRSVPSTKLHVSIVYTKFSARVFFQRMDCCFSIILLQSIRFIDAPLPASTSSFHTSPTSRIPLPLLMLLWCERSPGLYSIRFVFYTFSYSVVRLSMRRLAWT